MGSYDERNDETVIWNQSPTVWQTQVGLLAHGNDEMLANPLPLIQAVCAILAHPLVERVT